MFSLTSWIVDVIRRATPRPVRALSALMIAMVIHTLWRKRTNTENSGLENASSAETTVEISSSSISGVGFEGQDQGNESHNKITVQLDPETATKSRDSSAVVLSEKVFKTKEVSNGFEAGSRKSSRTEASINVDNALPEKLVDIPTFRPNGIDTDNSKLGKVSCAEETDKEEGYLEQFHNNEILNGIINNVRTVDSRKNMCFASPCNSSYGEVSNTYTRLIATVSQVLNEYDTNVGLLKKSSKSLIEQRAPDEKSNLPIGCNGSSAELETASVVCKKAPAKDKVDAIWGEFFNLTEELIKKTEASIQRFRVKVLEIVDEDDDGDFVSSKDGFLDDGKSAVESLSSSTQDVCFEGQDLCYINENWNEKSEQLAANMAKSKEISTKMLPEEEVFRTQEVSNDLETSFRESSETDVSTRAALASDDVLPEKKEVTDVNGYSTINALDLSESLRAEGCQKDQVLINDGANILNYFQRESDGREVESSKSKLIEDAGYVDACDMLLSLTQSLQLSCVLLNGFTFHDNFANCSYYAKLLISSLTPGNCTDKAILDNHSNLGSENNHDKDKKVSDNDTWGKLKDICKTNTNFKNFVLNEFLKEGFTLNYHIPENKNRHDTLTAGYREPEYQYLLDGTGDSEEKESLLESSFEEPNERTEVCGSGCYTVSSYTLPQEVEGNTSISSLDGESEVRIEHDDFEVITYRVISADLLRYKTENSLDFEESKDPFRPSFPKPKVEKKQRGRDDSLKFEDSFTVLPETDSETGEKMNCVVLLQVDPERRPVDTKEQNVKGDGFEPIEDRDDDDDDDDEKKVDEKDENSSEWRKGEYRGEEGSEKNGESSENPGDGQNGGGTGSGGGGGDDKKNGDSKGKNVKDESSEEEGQNDDEDKNNKENAGVSSEKDSNLDEKNGNGGIDTGKNISKDPVQSEVKEIVHSTTSLNVDYSTKLMRDALYSYKIKRQVRSTRKVNTPKQFEPLKKKKVGGEDKDKEGDDGQTEDGNPSGGREEHGEKDRKVKEGESSGEIGGAAHGSGGGSGSSGGGDDKKKGNDFVRGKVEEEEKESSEEEKSESEDASRPSNKDFTESELNSGGSTVPESLQAIVGEVRSLASKASGKIDRRTYGRLFDKFARKTCASGEGRNVREEIREFGRNREMQSNPEGGEKCKRLFGKAPASETKSEGDVGENSDGGQVTRSDQRSKDDLENLPQPAQTSSSDAPSCMNQMLNSLLGHSFTRTTIYDNSSPCPIPTLKADQPDIDQTEVQIGTDNLSVEQQSSRSSNSRTPKKGKAAAEGGDGSRKLKYPQGPTAPKRPRNVKVAAFSAAQSSKSPSKAKKSPIKNSERGKELSTEPKRLKKAEDARVSPAKGSKASKPKESAIESSECGKVLSTDQKGPKKIIDGLVVSAYFSPMKKAKDSKSPSKAEKSPIKSSERGKEPSNEPKRPKTAEDAAVSQAKGSKLPKASKPKESAIESSECGKVLSTEPKGPKKIIDGLVVSAFFSPTKKAKDSKSPSKAEKSPIKSSERGKELSNEPKRPKTAEDAAVSPAKRSKLSKASKPKEAAIESSERGKEVSTEPKNLNEMLDVVIISALDKCKEPQKAPEVHMLTIQREHGREKRTKSKKPKEAAAPKPKEGKPDHVVFGETMVPLSEINVRASCSYLPPTEEAERPLTPPIPRPSSSHFASSTSSLDHSRGTRYHATASWGPHGVIGPFYEGYLPSIDFSLSDEDIGSCSDDDVYLAPYHTYAPPHPPVELPQDPHSRLENVDEMQEQNPGPLDLSKKN